MGGVHSGGLQTFVGFQIHVFLLEKLSQNRPGPPGNWDLMGENTPRRFKPHRKSIPEPLERPPVGGP